MTYYIGIHPDAAVHNATVWCVEGNKLKEVTSSQVNDIVSGTSPNWVVKDLSDWKFIPMKLNPGEFYRRMARPTTKDTKDRPGVNPMIDKALVEEFRGQLVALREGLERIFRVVHPVSKNFGTYGHDIRNLLILAATEVEAQWKGILKANGVDGSTTKDYVKLLEAMKLDSYAVKLPFYPWLDAVKPFEGWSATVPTKSLAWYDAYNAVKHDRELLFERGSLYCVIQAVCACAIMAFAQFGRGGFHDSRALLTFFHLSEMPEWDYAELYALVRPDIFSLKSVRCPF